MMNNTLYFFHMDFFEVIKQRRSIRQFTSQPVEEALIQNAFNSAILAPNSSNTQTWDFYWVRSPDVKDELVKACLSQAAARTAAELVVVTADPKRWKRSQKSLVQWALDSKAPKPVIVYYEKLIPLTYTWGLFNFLAPFKWSLSLTMGLFKPFLRGPITRRDLQEVAIKSAALACENFVLALTAQGVSTCMMEGFDEWRVKSILSRNKPVNSSARVVMVIAIGYDSHKGVWGPQWRLPVNDVVHLL